MKTLSPRRSISAHKSASITAWLSAALLFLLSSSAAFSQAVQTFSSVREASRTSTSTALVDWWQVDTKAGKLISLYGYNAGSQQFILVFDSATGPTNIVSGFSSTAETFTNINHGLSLGSPIQLTGTVAGSAAGIYYVIPVDTNRFSIATTRANAIAGTAIDLTGSSASATLNRLPIHTFAIGAADNYSCIVPITGLTYSKGLVIAVSTSGPLYTAGTKDVTATVTITTP